MKQKPLRTIALTSLALVVMLAAAWQAQAQVAKAPETRSVEFKQAGSWADVGLRGKLIRTALSLADTRDGGVIIVGMKVDPGHPGQHLPDPLTDEQF
jgi:hypothetical protein